MLHTASHSTQRSDEEALLIGPLVSSTVDEFASWRDADDKRLEDEYPDTANHLNAGIRLAMNVAHIAVAAAADPAEKLDRTQQTALEELRALRDTFAPESEIRAAAAKLRQQQRVLKPLVVEHEIIAMEAGRMFDQLATRLRLLLYPTFGVYSVAAV